MKTNRIQINEGDLVIISGGSSWTTRKIIQWLTDWTHRQGFHSVSFETHENPELKETSITIVSGISLGTAFERDVLNENG